MRADLPSELELVIDNYGSKMNEIVDAFARELEETPAPDTIYHYTDGTGLKGILESGKLWFTDIFNLNDPSELRHGVNLAADRMSSVANSADSRPEAKQFAANFSALVAGGIERVAHFFVCCFSRNGDDLGQWRAYGDDGRGYAIGFDAATLETNFTKPGGIPVPNHATFPITYNDGELHEMHRKIISEAMPLISFPRTDGFDMHFVNQYMSELSVVFTLPILRSAIFFKHEAYKNEEEYRFLDLRQAGPVEGLKFRTRPYALVRYREFDWKTAAPAALKKIVVGPAGDQVAAARYADACLRAFHPSASVNVSASAIPYKASRNL